MNKNLKILSLISTGKIKAKHAEQMMVKEFRKYEISYKQY